MDLAQGLADRQRGERLNFVAGLKNPTTLQEACAADYFTALLALAVNDYGASATVIALDLHLENDQVVTEWIEGKNLPELDVRQDTIRSIERQMEKALQRPAVH